MTICLCQLSALECLREASASSWSLSPLPRRAALAFIPCAREVKQLESLGCGFLSKPLYLLVANAADRRKIKGTVCRLCPSDVASCSILVTRGGLLTEGPQLCFLHRASELTLPLLVEMGFELCGSYRIYPADPKGFLERAPLTSRSQLIRFVEGVCGAKGSARAKRAMVFVRDGSRSPMETIVVMLLCLSPWYGGYGLPMPHLNYRVNVSRNARKASANGYYLCDAFWPEALLDVEYDSDLAHTGSTRISHDAKRRNGLISMGITVITVTREQVLDCDEMDKVAHAVAQRLDRRLRLGGKGWMRRRAELRRQLLDFSRPH